MKWPDDFKQMENICHELGSPYAAAMYCAKKSRRLFDESCKVLQIGESLTWAITDEVPPNLEKRIKQAKEISERRDLTPIDEILCDIDDKNIRDAVYNSYRMSINARHLTYDYKDIEDEHIQARIRILTKMCYLKNFYAE